jgi:phosphate/sulfate permease
LIKTTILIFLVLFFAMNMGASGIAPSFAAIYGGKIIRKKYALGLFGVFVVFGAILLGRNVTLTLGKGLLPQEHINFDVVLIILGSAALSLFVANLVKIPQSTSQVTVSAIVGVGMYLKQLCVKTLLFKVLPMWIILPLVSYVLTFFLYRKFYPPVHGNLHFYEKIFANEKNLRWVAIGISCYVALAIGSNNVANAVGPLYGGGIIGVGTGLLMVAPLFGLGAGFLGNGPLETAGKEIVPLGLVSSTLISLVTATLLIYASWMGVPQSLVQLNLASVFAVGCVKNGHRYTLDQRITRKTFLVWAITPLISLCVSYLLSFLILKK